MKIAVRDSKRKEDSAVVGRTACNADIETRVLWLIPVVGKIAPTAVSKGWRGDPGKVICHRPKRCLDQTESQPFIVGYI